jgi:hypothetical protein
MLNSVMTDELETIWKEEIKVLTSHLLEETGKPQNASVRTASVVAEI